MNRLDNVLNINFSLYKFVKITAAYIYMRIHHEGKTRVWQRM